MGLFSRNLKAVNTAYSTEANATGSKNLIGNVWVNFATQKVFLKNEGRDNYGALLSISTTNEMGKIDKTHELVIKPNQEIDVRDILDAYATGIITWSKVGQSAIDSNSENEISYYASIKDWDGKRTELYQIKGNTYGLSIRIDTIKNELYIKAENESYKNIHVYVIGYDGSDYDFDLIDLKQGQSIAISYPATMDELLPINRISIWFELDERQISNLLDDDTIQERLDATLTRLGISEQ